MIPVKFSNFFFFNMNEAFNKVNDSPHLQNVVEYSFENKNIKLQAVYTKSTISGKWSCWFTINVFVKEHFTFGIVLTKYIPFEGDYHISMTKRDDEKFLFESPSQNPTDLIS